MYNGSPAHLANLAKARAAGLKKTETCSTCSRTFTKAGITNHERYCSATKNCAVCGKEFRGKATTCSYACSNTYFRSGEDHGNWKEEAYRSTCFAKHEKKCVVCSEDKIVEVHHLDEDRDNNSPENLIPLCPTHHQYWHSRYKHLVEPIVLEYVTKWREEQVRVLLP